MLFIITRFFHAKLSKHYNQIIFCSDVYPLEPNFHQTFCIVRLAYHSNKHLIKNLSTYFVLVYYFLNIRPAGKLRQTYCNVRSLQMKTEYHQTLCTGTVPNCYILGQISYFSGAPIFKISNTKTITILAY